MSNASMLDKVRTALHAVVRSELPGFKLRKAGSTYLRIQAPHTDFVQADAVRWASDSFSIWLRFRYRHESLARLLSQSAPRPPGLSDAEYRRARDQVSPIFEVPYRLLVALPQGSLTVRSDHDVQEHAARIVACVREGLAILHSYRDIQVLKRQLEEQQNPADNAILLVALYAYLGELPRAREVRDRAADFMRLRSKLDPSDFLRHADGIIAAPTGCDA